MWGLFSLESYTHAHTCMIPVITMNHTQSIVKRDNYESLKAIDLGRSNDFKNEEIEKCDNIFINNLILKNTINNTIKYN